MRKVCKYLLLACFSIMMLWCGVTNAYAAGATLSGPSEVRVGDTITLTLKVSDSGKYGLEGKLIYDANQLTLSSVTTGLSGWKVEEGDESTIIVYDDGMSNAISGTKTVLTFKFKVKSTVEVGSTINISYNNIVSTDGTNENQLGDATYSVTVARALSSNANLGSLTVAEGNLSPSFKPGTTTYDIGEVEYDVKTLTITCAPEDEYAKGFEIKANSLFVGKNTVSITVTAENGNKKTYKINVTRKQDPNYVAGSNANLKSLTVSQGILSPKFNASVTDYIVYLPFECIGTSFTASGSEADSKAQGVISGTIDSLVEGKNQTVVVCRAEDGTEKNYVVVVYVMPKYEGVVPNIGFGPIKPDPNPGTDPGSNPGNTEVPGDSSSEEDTQKPTDDSTEKPSVKPSEKPSEEPSEDPGKKPADSKDDNMLLTILVLVVVIALVGALIYVLFFPKKKR